MNSIHQWSAALSTAAPRFFWLALLLGLMGQIAPLRATTVVPPSFDELVKEAEIIFEGRVIAMESKWLGQDQTRRIQTDYTFEVQEVLKGRVPATYVLEVLGGTVGEVTLKVEGSPDFKAGDRSILFVKQNGTQFIPLVGIMHGHYRVKRDAALNQEVVVKHDGEVLESVDRIGKTKVPPPVRETGKNPAVDSAPVPGAAAVMTPADFKNRIRAKKQELER